MTISLQDLHTSIQTAIHSRFPDLVTVDSYPDDRLSLRVPACLFEIASFEPVPDEDPGTEQLAVAARIEARVIMGFRTPLAKIEVRNLATALAVFVHQNRWSLPVGAAEVTAIEPDDFSPELDRYETWRVEWQQVLHLGESVWTNDGTIPTEVLASWAPDIGVPHEPDYSPIDESLAP